MAELTKLPFVSILTPTYNRRLFISQYLKYVRNQDYRGRLEVLVADDGEDSVADLFYSDETIRYIRLDKRMPLGYKRNLLASEAKGHILVHMDDDDYYPPNRVSHAVTKLLSSEKLIAGASQCYFYNLMEEKITVSGPFGNNHATCGTFAYFKEYAKTHGFDDHVFGQEEPVFTKNFSEPMVQLNPLSTMLVMQHRNNTWDKANTTTKPTNHKLQDFIKSNDDRRFYRRLVKSIG